VEYDKNLEVALDIVSEAIYSQIVCILLKKYSGEEMIPKVEIKAVVPVNIKEMILNEHNVTKWKVIQEKVNALLLKHNVVCFSLIYILDDECKEATCDLFTCCMYLLWKRMIVRCVVPFTLFLYFAT